MLTLGYKTDCEDKVICDYVELMKLLEFEHPEDAALKAHKRRCMLIAIQRLTEEQAMLKNPRYNILQDRMRECEDCERDGYRQCKDPEKEKKCKWQNPKHLADTLRSVFGQDAFDWVDKYSMDEA